MLLVYLVSGLRSHNCSHVLLHQDMLLLVHLELHSGSLVCSYDLLVLHFLTLKKLKLLICERLGLVINSWKI
jgi:hypothetical protein